MAVGPQRARDLDLAASRLPVFKARRSRSLGVSAAILVTFDGAIHVAAFAAGRLVFDNRGFMLLALAAGCLACDHSFGYSSEWIRDIAGAISIRSPLSDFQLAWVRETAALARENLRPKRSSAHLTLSGRSLGASTKCSGTRLNRGWPEFNASLSELESRLRQSQTKMGRRKRNYYGRWPGSATGTSGRSCLITN